MRGNPQPQLGSFLQRTMPAFRQAMASGRIQIQGIQPPVLAPPIPQDPQAQMALASPTGGLPPQAAQIYSASLSIHSIDCCYI